jgi:predicted Rossmann fold nucleotide-binding protein DprA/Smf involved in DNA uptake
MISLGIIGSRDFTDNTLFETSLQKLLTEHNFVIKEIISGGAKGADTLAEKYSIKNNIPIRIFYPDWSLYGKKAGPIRNRQIVESSDYILAFWDGQSRGTKSSIDIANELGKPIHIINYINP